VHRLLHLVLSFCLLLVMAGCGGGGGGGSSAAGNSISLDRASVSLMLGSGTHDVAQTEVSVSFKGAGVVVAMLPGQVQPAWLRVTAGSPVNGRVSFILGATDAGLVPGNYPVTLRFATGNADQTGVVTQDLQLTLTVAPRMTLSSGVLDLDAIAGGASVSVAQVAVDAPNWSVKGTAPWLVVDRAQGAGAATVSVSFNPAGLTPGDYTATLIAQDTATSATRELPVRLTLQARRLAVHRPAVTLVQYANRSALSAAVHVADTGWGATGFTAAADQAWLKLAAASGTTPLALGVSADASGLPDGLHLARITLTPTDAAVSNAVVVRVALDVRRGLAVASPLVPAAADIACNALDYWRADPLRPRVFQACRDRLNVFDAYGGSKLASLTLAGAGLESMTVAPDGSMLFIMDTVQKKIQRVDLDQLTVLAPISLTRPGIGTLAYTEVQGVPVVATGGLEFFNAGSGVRLTDAADQYDRLGAVALRIAASADGLALYGVGNTQANHDLLRLSLSMTDGALKVRRTHLMNERGSGNGLALNETGTLLYSFTGVIDLPQGGSAGAVRRDPRTLAALSYPPMVDGLGASSAAGFAAGQSWLIYGNSVARIDAAAAVLGSYRYGDFITQASMGGDGRRMVVVGSAAANKFVRFVDAP
jgi:hypothetical protein